MFYDPDTVAVNFVAPHLSNASVEGLYAVVYPNNIPLQMRVMGIYENLSPEGKNTHVEQLLNSTLLA